MAYYGLFRVGELTFSSHVVRVKDVHIGQNKNKLLFVLHTSKMHGRDSWLQTVKIVGQSLKKRGNSHSPQFCPFQLLQEYLQHRKAFHSKSEQFFVFCDRSPVGLQHMRNALKNILSIAGFDPALYGTHSLRIGMATDMLHYGIEIETIKKVGCWRSNCVYHYLK